MTSTNNFKEMAREDQELIPHTPERVEKQVMGVVKSGQFAGNVLELYFSKMIETILMLFGASTKNHSENKDESSGEVR